MSDGPFTGTKYEDNKLSIHPIRVQPEGAPVHGAPPAGAIDTDISAQVGGSRRTYGLHARGVRLYRTLGVAPNTFRRYTFLPVLTQTVWNGISREQEFTIDGTAWKVAGKVEEKMR